MSDHISPMDVFAGVDTHAAGSQVGVVSKYAGCDFQDDKVPIKSTRRQIGWLRMNCKRLIVRLSIPRVADHTVCHCKHLCVIAEPCGILRCLRGIRRDRQCVACGVEPNEIDGKTLSNRYCSVH